LETNPEAAGKKDSIEKSEMEEGRKKKSVGSMSSRVYKCRRETPELSRKRTWGVLMENEGLDGGGEHERKFKTGGHRRGRRFEAN